MNDYEVRFRFSAHTDAEARRRIHQGIEELGSMQIVNLGERNTLKTAAKGALIALLWVAGVRAIWPCLVEIWRHLL